VSFVNDENKNYERQAHIMWVPVTMAWHVHGLWMEEVTSSYGG